jgi:hypothetical protein
MSFDVVGQVTPSQGREQELQPRVRKMERSGKRGKIPQQDWPSIIKRYEAGETLASIARTYDCSPPAISYILSRSRARDSEQTSEPAELPLVKGQENDMQAPTNQQSPQEAEEAAGPAAEAATSDLLKEQGQEREPPELKSISDKGSASADKIQSPLWEVNGPTELRRDAQADTPTASEKSPALLAAAGSPPQRAAPRRTLHLPLSQNGSQNSEASRHQGASTSMSERSPARAGENQELLRTIPGYYGSGGGDALTTVAAEPSRANENTTFIDQALRDRVDSDISAFLAAFDAALAHDTLENRAGLRQATDRLLRAGARTRIELERLEARVPLVAPDHRGFGTPSWRPR